MGRHARKLITADGIAVNRPGKLRSITWATSDTGSAILHNGTSGGDPEIYRFLQGTGIHDNLDLGFDKLFIDVTGTVSFNIIYE